MKPYEETWSTSGDGVLLGVDFRAPFSGLNAEARAKLAAQAPAMARLLLSFLEQGDPSEKEKLAAVVLRAAGVIP